MRHPFYFILAALALIGLALAACSPAASTPAVQPTAPAAQPTMAEATPAPAAAATAGMPASTETELPDVDPSQLSGNIIAAGSSTVYPLSEAIADQFKADGFTGEVNISSIGSGAGFERFCKTGETDIANASRAIKDSEVENCKAIGRDPIEFRVGTDALAVIVNKDNDFLTDITADELAKIFSDQAEKWSDINPAWPAEEIKRYVPGTDSGTFDFFIEAVMEPAYGKVKDNADKNGKTAFLNAKNLNQSEDDNVLVEGVAGNKYAVGFFGFAYYHENTDKLHAVAIDGVAPDFDSAESGEYPLARPLFIYSDARIMKEKPRVAAFINYYLTYVNDVISDVGYFPASEEALHGAKQAWLEAMK